VCAYFATVERERERERERFYGEPAILRFSDSVILECDRNQWPSTHQVDGPHIFGYVIQIRFKEISNVITHCR